MDGSTQVNRYDGEGLRHEMEENGRLVQFLFSGQEVVAQSKEDGAVVRYLRGYELVGSDSEQARTYYHYASDEMGSITHVVAGDSKEVLNEYCYDAFGNTVYEQEQVENRFRYAGQQYDGVTGQYYLRARYYNPVIGRFTQEDTYYGDGLNLYAYCRGNPVGYYDPSGYGKEMYQSVQDIQRIYGVSELEAVNIYKLFESIDEIPASEFYNAEKPSQNVYIPLDEAGNPIPLEKQRVNGQDVPLPDPNAKGAHTVLGSKISSDTGEVYRQSATFLDGTWPLLKGQNVPLSEVHWGNHGQPHHHPDPHQHIFKYDKEGKGGWYRGTVTIFND